MITNELLEEWRNSFDTTKLPGMEQMLVEGDANNFYFVGFDGIRYTPEELMRKQIGGSFRWGTVNWHPRPIPSKTTLIERLQEKIKFYTQEMARIESGNIKTSDY